MTRRPGFTPEELEPRYDVECFTEDEWHSYSGQRTTQIITDCLELSRASSRLLLNAGAGVHQLNLPSWSEVSVDLFAAPIRRHKNPILADIENLPFGGSEFGAVVCVGEVLGYCDPACAIAEFARVLVKGGVLICDFGNSRSLRFWSTPTYRRAADMIQDTYIGTAENVWVYDPEYIQSVLASVGFTVRRIFGTHTWSALSRRLGASPRTAVRLQKMLDWLPQSASHADITTIAAVRS